MVVYTCTGLSIIAEPIVERRTAARRRRDRRAVAIPADALTFDAEIRLKPVGPDKVAARKLTYQVLAPRSTMARAPAPPICSMPMRSPTAGACGVTTTPRTTMSSSTPRPRRCAARSPP